MVAEIYFTRFLRRLLIKKPVACGSDSLEKTCLGWFSLLLCLLPYLLLLPQNTFPNKLSVGKPLLSGQPKLNRSSEQLLANYGQWPKLLCHFVSKVFLERSHAFLFIHYCDYFHAISRQRRETLEETNPAKPQFFI